MNITSTTTFGRRSLMKATGALGLAAAAGGLAVAAPAQAAVTSARFNFTSSAYKLFGPKSLVENRTHQALAFDNVNRRLFMLQGRRDSTGNDLCLNRVSFGGTPLGAMYLDNIGHGVGFGVEPVGSDSYIWCEALPDSSGRATALKRFKWIPGTKPANVTYHFTGRRDVSCGMDPVNHRLLVRYIPADSVNGHTNVLYDLPFGHPSQLKKISEFYLPRAVSSLGPLQGFVPYGNYMYVLTGTSHQYQSDIDSTLAAVDMSNSKQVGSSVVTYAGADLPYREPEGLGVYRSVAGNTGLYYGFSSRDSYSGLKVTANIYYKNQML
jgi:receptor-binding protein